jgi:hypothetical protein
MLAESERLPSRASPREYAPEITPLLQALLSTLADIDLAYESGCCRGLCWNSVTCRRA